MKARIGVMSEELIRKRILSIAAGAYQPQENEPKVWFTYSMPCPRSCALTTWN